MEKRTMTRRRRRASSIYYGRSLTLLALVPSPYHHRIVFLAGAEAAADGRFPRGPLDANMATTTLRAAPGVIVDPREQGMAVTTPSSSTHDGDSSSPPSSVGESSSRRKRRPRAENYAVDRRDDECANDARRSPSHRPPPPPSSISASADPAMGGGAPYDAPLRRVLLALTSSSSSYLGVSGPVVVRCASFIVRLAIASYVARATYDVVKEAWEEVREEAAATSSWRRGSRRGRRPRNGGDVDDVDSREEQDMPYADADALSRDEDRRRRRMGEGGADHDVDDGRDDGGRGRRGSRLADAGGTGGRGRWRRSSRREEDHDECDDEYDGGDDDEVVGGSMRTIATRELATRLHSAGIPYAYEASYPPPSDEDPSSSTTTFIATTVEGIMRSLTRAEGNMLSQTLLSPSDSGGGGRAAGPSSSAAAAAAWNAIGGLSDAKESLLDLAFPLLPVRAVDQSDDSVDGDVDDGDKNVDDHYGGLLANPPGVLLYGPPGCGKTMLVRALSATVGARFLVVSPSCLLRKYVGETNLNARALFSAARKVAPCVIFVDELDGLFRERSGEDHDVGRDLKTEFLQLWDGVRDCRDGRSSILVIGATNRPFDVDPAFLRRMPRRVYVGPPDYDSRLLVLRGMLERVPLDPDFDVDVLARRTEGYSPSDIREVLQSAALYPLREAREEAISSSRIGKVDRDGEDVGMRMPPLRRLRTDDVLRALQVARPTQFSRRYQQELTNYLHKSGKSIVKDQPGADLPSIAEREMHDEDCMSGANSYCGEHSKQGTAHESDSNSFDEDESSDSDYD